MKWPLKEIRSLAITFSWVIMTPKQLARIPVSAAHSCTAAPSFHRHSDLLLNLITGLTNMQVKCNVSLCKATLIKSALHFALRCAQEKCASSVRDPSVGKTTAN